MPSFRRRRLPPSSDLRQQATRWLRQNRDKLPPNSLQEIWRIMGQLDTLRRELAKQNEQLERIAQEGLTNACRHSRSPTIRLRLARQGRNVILEVEDWGVGLDPDRVAPAQFGLKSIRERARLFGGRAQIESAPGHRTRVRVDLPLRTKPLARKVSC